MNTLRQAAQQALEALLLPTMKTQQMLIQRDEAIIALRRALEQPEHTGVGGCAMCGAAYEDQVIKAQPDQELVGEVLNERGEVDYISYVPPVGTRLYTAPPAAKQQCAQEAPHIGHDCDPFLADSMKVFCPACCTKFRAIPNDVQELLLGVGFEPPFTPPPAAQRKKEHITNGDPCWCNPEIDYVDPETGVAVIVHKEPQ